jgi:hypothetical protein
VDQSASSQLEGEKIDPQAATSTGIHGYQAVGWWTLFGGVAATTAGGVFLGLMDASNSDARRIAERYEVSTSRHPIYGDVKKSYERSVDEAHRYQVTSHVLLISGAVALVASIPFFVIHQRRAKSQAQASSRFGRHGLEFKF